MRPSYPRKAIRAALEPIYTAYEESPFSTPQEALKDQIISQPPLLQASSSQSASGRNSGPLQLLELGAGTGISTRAMLDCLWEEASESIDFVIHCVEPSSAMRDQFRLSMTTAAKEEEKGYYMDHIEISAGSATSIPYPNGFFHGCVAAQSFHWFGTDEAVSSIAAKLTLNGVFAAIWNDYCIPGTWHGEVFDDIVRPLYQNSNTPHFLTGEATKALREHSSFGPLQELKFSGDTHWLNEDMIKERMLTVSVIANLEKGSGGEQEKVLERILEIAKSHGQKAEVENEMKRGGKNDEAVYRDIDGERFYRMDYIIDIIHAQKKHDKV